MSTYEKDEFPSLTQSALQVRWRVPTEFPACPEFASDAGLQEYASGSAFGGVFAQNAYYRSLTVQHRMAEDGLVVLTHSPDDAIKAWAVAHVSLRGDIFYHRNESTFLTLQGALMRFCELTGESYDDSIDNYC